ncbi:MAG: site-specific integrase [Sedimenticola sp.]
MKKKWPVAMDWIPLKPRSDREVPFYLNQYLEPITPFIEFTLAIAKWKDQTNKQKSRNQAYKSFINFYAYALQSLSEYLAHKVLSWDEVDDIHLKNWFSWEIARVRKRNASKDDEKTAMRTVNRKLTGIYRFYAWAQCRAGFLPPGYVGSNGRIKTTLVDAYERGLNVGPLVLSVKKKDHEDIVEGMYPLTEEGVGTPVGDYAATEDDIQGLINHFYDSAKTEYLAERNVLILDIADQVGLRSNAIASLRIDQFSNVDITQHEGHILIQPEKQKYGYTKYFEFPAQLVERIRDYIDDERKEHMASLKLTEVRVKRALFLTNRGKPITEKRISETMAAAFQAIGHEPGKGAAAHSPRRKRAQDVVDQELALRTRVGQPHDPETMALAVANALGQSNINSSGIYTKSREKLRAKNLEAQLAMENASLRGELSSAKAEISRLNRLLNKSEKS